MNNAVRAVVTKHGLPFFVAASNNGDDAWQYSPASVEDAFVVGGSDRQSRMVQLCGLVCEHVCSRIGYRV